MLQGVYKRIQWRKNLRCRNAPSARFCRLLQRDAIAGSGRAVKGSNRGDSSIMRKIFHFLRKHWKAVVVAAAASSGLDLLDAVLGTHYKEPFIGCLFAIFVLAYCVSDAIEKEGVGEINVDAPYSDK